MATGNDDDSFLDLLADQDLVAKENEAQNISRRGSIPVARLGRLRKMNSINFNTTKVERSSPRQVLGYRNISYPHSRLVPGSSYCVSFQT